MVVCRVFTAPRTRVLASGTNTERTTTRGLYWTAPRLTDFPSLVHESYSSVFPFAIRTENVLKRDGGGGASYSYADEG